MKDRLKKFYHDHEDTVHSYALAAAGIAVYTVGLVKFVAARHEIADVARKDCDESELHVRVVKKNGKTSYWHWHTDQ
jgi:hypothetical protein